MAEEIDNKCYYEQLFEAINESCIEGFRNVCMSADIKPLHFYHWTPLAEAAAKGQTEMLWVLIHDYDFGAEDHFEFETDDNGIVFGIESARRIDAFNFCRGTALTLAIEGKHWASVAFLVSAGASVNAKFYQATEEHSEHGNKSGVKEGNCLSLAIENNAPQRIIQLMADNGLDVDATWGRENDNMLSIAVREQKTALVETLLELGAAPNQTLYVPGDDRMHPLYWIIQNYSDSDTFQLLAITKLLMDYGADVDFDMHDNSDHDIYQAALSLGNESLLCAMGLVGRMVKELTQFRVDAGL